MTPTTLDELQQILALEIKHYRKQSGLSQEELAHVAEIDRTYVSQLERALVNPSLAVLLRVANALHVHVNQLLTKQPKA